VRVVIAEDLALLRDGLTRLLRDNEIEVVAAVADGESLVREVLALRPDLAIVDVRLPPGYRDEGLRAALEVRHRLPGTAVLVISQYVEPTYAEELLADRGGGVGYLLKDRVMYVTDFLEAVRRVADGGTALDPEVVAQHVQSILAKLELPQSSSDHRRVLAVLAYLQSGE
jgi:DNA-binding NarL/FixJ family response regulator